MTPAEPVSLNEISDLPTELLTEELKLFNVRKFSILFWYIILCTYFYQGPVSFIYIICIWNICNWRFLEEVKFATDAFCLIYIYVKFCIHSVTSYGNILLCTNFVKVTFYIFNISYMWLPIAQCPVRKRNINELPNISTNIY